MTPGFPSRSRTEAHRGNRLLATLLMCVVLLAHEPVLGWSASAGSRWTQPPATSDDVHQTASARDTVRAFVTEQGLAEFTSRAPLLTFTGTSRSLIGLIDLKQNLLDFYVDLNTLDTGIELRNRHMRDSYLETEEFPYAEFRGRLAAVPDFAESDTASVTALGTFRIHGVDRELQVDGSLIRIPGGLRLAAQWEIQLSDFDIDIPNVVFYELSETQNVRILAEFGPYTP